MSVLIQGIKKPTSCDSCDYENLLDCELWKLTEAGDCHKMCPIIAVPDRGMVEKMQSLALAQRLGTGHSEKDEKAIYDAVYLYELCKFAEQYGDVVKRPEKPEPCEDAISKKKVIDYLCDHICASGVRCNSVCRLVKGVKEIPSVTPKPCEDASQA